MTHRAPGGSDVPGSGCGPCGVSVEAQLARNEYLGASFQQGAWESMKQEGCRPCGGVGASRLPTWPPTGAWVMPQYARDAEEVIGLDFDGAPPFEVAERPYGNDGCDAPRMGGQGAGSVQGMTIEDEAEMFARVIAEEMDGQAMLRGAAQVVTEGAAPAAADYVQYPAARAYGPAARADAPDATVRLVAARGALGCGDKIALGSILGVVAVALVAVIAYTFGKERGMQRVLDAAAAKKDDGPARMW
jgi:hypothetical protein